MGRRRTGKGRPAGPSVGGIFDIIRRMMPPLPGAPPPEPPAGLPALPAPPGPPGLPVPAPGRGFALFEALRPKEGPGILAPYLPPKSMFQPFAPTVPQYPALPPEEAAPPAPSLWPALFQEEEEPAVPQMFAFMAPEEAAPVPAPPTMVPAGRYEIRWPAGEPVPLWRIATAWAMPSTMEITHRLQGWDLPALWDHVLMETDYPGWRRDVEDAAHTGVPARLDIELLASRWDPYDALSHYLGIPAQVFNAYFGLAKNERELQEAGDAYFREIVLPVLDRFTKAMDILKPPSLRGWFDISPSGAGGDWWLAYNETRYRPGA